MMSPQTMRRLATGLAITSAVAALFFAMAWFRRAQASNTAEATEKVRVVISTQSIGATELLHSDSGKFRVVERPKSAVPEGSLQRLEDLDGKVTLGPIAADQ